MRRAEEGGADELGERERGVDGGRGDDRLGRRGLRGSPEGVGEQAERVELSQEVDEFLLPDPASVFSVSTRLDSSDRERVVAPREGHLAAESGVGDVCENFWLLVGRKKGW